MTMFLIILLVFILFSLWSMLKVASTSDKIIANLKE